jgi:hypothetical protein
LKALTDRQVVAVYADALRRLLTVDEEDPARTASSR